MKTVQAPLNKLAEDASTPTHSQRVVRVRTARLDPKVDITFKLLFTKNPTLLAHMLEAVLGEPVSSVEILNPEIPGDLSGDKSVELDVRVRLASGARVDVEMQIRFVASLTSRFTYYVTRDHAGQLPRGGNYRELTPTIAVVWMVEPLFKELKQYHSVFELRERRTQWLFTSQIAIHLLQLAYINVPTEKPTARDEAVRRWGRFFLATTDEELETLAKEDPIMSDMLTAINALSQDPVASRLERDRAESLYFYRYSLSEERKAGAQEGKIDGLREGKIESVLAVLGARGLAVSDDQKARLMAETELAVLERWLVGAATVSSVDDVFQK